MENEGLVIVNPEVLDDKSFKINISGKDYTYEISEDKDIDKVVNKISTWIDRGPNAMGGLYDYIKRSYKLVGEYQEPIVEDEGMEDEGPEEQVLPSEDVDLDETLENVLDIVVEEVSKTEVKLTIGEFDAVFTVVGSMTTFLDELSVLIKEDMTLLDREKLNVFLLKGLETDVMEDFYNLSGIITDESFELVSSLEVDEEPEDETIEEPVVEEPVEESVLVEADDVKDLRNKIRDGYAKIKEIQEKESIKNPNKRVEDIQTKETIKIMKDIRAWGDELDELRDRRKDLTEADDVSGDILLGDVQVEELPEVSQESEEDISVEDLAASESFISKLSDLGLSLFRIKSKDMKEDSTLFFIGGVNSSNGSLYSLSFDFGVPYISLGEDFKSLKGNAYELNNFGDMETVTKFIDKLLSIVYNKELEGGI